ncbi:hypothetical protein [Thermococcus sp.]|uniref:hypothetical protein n=1 Tax=Thermococcus sp. TaxID=35749 RepID=UPI00263514A2|nr:hypothetical protein [Thermococcus sp.]
MKRAQLSIDLLFAVTLISLTILSLVSMSVHEAQGARTLDTMAKLKVFTIDLRDTVTKVYSTGQGFAVRKDSPILLAAGDIINVTLNASSDQVEVSALIGGRRYFTAQKLQVPLVSDSNVTLSSSNEIMWVVAAYNETVGMVDVRVKQHP